MPVIDELIRTEDDGSISFGNKKLAQKAKKSDFEYQGDLDQSTVCIRLVAGWYNTEEDVAALLALLKGTQP